MKRVVPVLIVIILILGVGGFFLYELIGKKYQPELALLDYKAELGLGEDEYSITLNRELLTDEHALEIDGRIYLQEDQSRIIRYRIRNEGHWYQLDYNVDTNGIVTSVDWRYIP